VAALYIWFSKNECALAESTLAHFESVFTNDYWPRGGLLNEAV
jgi:hypothetical protein